MDLGKLLEPVSDAEPSGPNLEYDPAFTALEEAAQGKPERQMGTTVVPAEPPDWNVVFAQAVALLGRSKDLRVASQLTLAALHGTGFRGFADGLGLIRKLLEEHWPTVHPILEEDGDATMRVTALSALGTPSVLATLRTTPIARSRSLGAVNLRAVLASGTAGPAEGVPDAATVEGVFLEAELETLEQFASSARDAAQHLSGIESALEANAGTRGPDFSALASLLFQAQRAVEPRIERRRAAELPPAAAEGATPVESQRARTMASQSLSGDIASREDVVRVLDKICAYYERNEPSSPLPLLLQRCKRLATLSFLDLVRDLAPDGVRQVEIIAGKTGE